MEKMNQISIRNSQLIFFLVALFIGYGSTVTAQGLTSNSMPELLRNVGIDQKLNAQIPLDIAFKNEAGEIIQLNEYFGEKPVILSLVYYECPMLCGMILNGLVSSLRVMNFDVGDQFNVLAVSFDHEETPALAAEKKRAYIHRYDRIGSEDGWHFLTGDENSIKKLTESVGFRYVYDAEKDQYAHASGIMILTPEGRVSRYYYGIEYSPKDMRLGLIEASENKIGSVVDQVLLYCFHYDPITGKYGLVIMNVIRLAGIVTVFAIGSFMLVMFRRDRKRSSMDDKHT